MGRPRKPPSELTTEEAVKKLFPRKVITWAKRVVNTLTSS